MILGCCIRPPPPPRSTGCPTRRMQHPSIILVSTNQQPGHRGLPRRRTRLNIILINILPPVDPPSTPSPRITPAEGRGGKAVAAVVAVEVAVRQKQRRLHVGRSRRRDD